MRLSTWLLGFLAITAMGCPRELAYRQCADHICPSDMSCCGDTCIAATCGDGVRDEGEQCDRWTGQACVDANADFGQVPCTATCEEAAERCTRFGFVPFVTTTSCFTDRPELVAARGATVWVSSTTTQVARIRDGACEAMRVDARLSQIVPLSEHEALALSYPRFVDNRGTWSVWHLGPTGATSLGTLTLPGADRLSEPLVVDEDLVVFGAATSTVLVRRTAGEWSWQRVQTTCRDNSTRRVEALLPFGDEVMAVFSRNATAAIPGAVYGVIDLPSLLAGNGQNPICAALVTPPVDDVNYRQVLPRPGGYYLLGQGARPIALAVSKVAGAAPQVRDLELGAPDNIVSFDRLVSAWTVDDTLHVAGCTTGCATPETADDLVDVWAYRYERWRHLDMPSRASTAVAVSEGRAVAGKPSGLDIASGWGYEIGHDFTQTRLGVCAAPANCQVAAAGTFARANMLDAELVLATRSNNVNILVVDGAPFNRVIAGFVWDPRLLEVSARIPWLGATTLKHDRAYLFRGIGEGGADPAPLVTDACGVEIAALDVNATAAFVAVRIGKPDDPACPISYRVFSRSAAGGSPVERWTSASRVIAIATPSDGSDGALVVVEQGAGIAVVAITTSGATEVAAIDMTGPADIWAASLDEAWVVGQSPSLVRFADGALTDASTTLGDDGNTALAAIAGGSGHDVFAGGAEGLLLHHDGATWTRVRRPMVSQRITWLAAGTEELRIAMGSRELALRVPRDPPIAPTCDGGARARETPHASPPTSSTK